MEFVSQHAPKAHSTGGAATAPAAFGQYETGRSQFEKGVGTPAFLDTRESRARPDNCVHEAKWRVDCNAGDPGRYDPYHYEDAGTNPAFNSSNKNRKAFDSTDLRTLFATLFGLDTPSIGAYPVFQADKTMGQLSDAVKYPKQDANVSIFRSKSLQRPSSSSISPGPAHYTPNVMATHPKMRDSGAQMRGTADRFNPARLKEMTADEVGPGAYRAESARYHGAQSLWVDCQDEMRRMSRLSRSGRIGFGSTSAQRGRPLFARDSPDPGHHQPDLYPRVRHRVLKEFAHVKAATDNDITDDEAGFARREAARASRARKAAEARELAHQNAEMRRRVASTGAATDNDVSDDAAGAARRRAAMASRKAKAAQAAELARQNTAHRRAVRETAARTDDDVTDEALGQARLAAAKASRERKADEARQLAAANAEYRHMIDTTGAATDNDITDDVAGAFRQNNV